MKLNKTTRTTLLVLLIAVGAIALVSIVRYLGFFTSASVDIGVRGGLQLGAFLASISVFTFAFVVIRDLLKNKSVHKGAFAISVILSIVAAIILLLFAYGIAKDLLGVYCSGFFGSQSSCTLSPLLILYVLVFHPIPLIVAGVISLYGIFNQLKI